VGSTESREPGGIGLQRTEGQGTHRTDELYEVDQVSTPECVDPARQRVVERIERKRHLHAELLVVGFGLVILLAIWAISEYHNAGGWPTQGYGQTSGIHDVWNYRIVYPVIAVALIVAARAWSGYGRRPLSESEITRKMERQSGRR
jgi:hypothetical protein